MLLKLIINLNYVLVVIKNTLHVDRQNHIKLLKIFNNFLSCKLVLRPKSFRAGDLDKCQYFPVKEAAKTLSLINLDFFLKEMQLMKQPEKRQYKCYVYYFFQNI